MNIMMRFMNIDDNFTSVRILNQMWPIFKFDWDLMKMNVWMKPETLEYIFICLVKLWWHVWDFKTFSTIFQSYHGGFAFLGVRTPEPRTTKFPSNWLLPQTISKLVVEEKRFHVELIPSIDSPRRYRGTAKNVAPSAFTRYFLKLA